MSRKRCPYIFLAHNVKYASLSYLGKMKRNDCVDDDVDGDGGNDQ